jgi:hypothetical protein
VIEEVGGGILRFAQDDRRGYWMVVDCCRQGEQAFFAEVTLEFFTSLQGRLRERAQDDKWKILLKEWE